MEAVGALGEPLWMLGVTHTVIRRRLGSAKSIATSRPSRLALATNRSKVSKSAEVWMDGVVPALLGADGPRRAWIGRARR